MCAAFDRPQCIPKDAVHARVKLTDGSCDQTSIDACASAFEACEKLPGVGTCGCLNASVQCVYNANCSQTVLGPLLHYCNSLACSPGQVSSCVSFMRLYCNMLTACDCSCVRQFAVVLFVCHPAVYSCDQRRAITFGLLNFTYLQWHHWHTFQISRSSVEKQLLRV
jgi:hypothetical protein